MPTKRDPCLVQKLVITGKNRDELNYLDMYESLVILICENIHLTHLPELPPKLERLNCSGNKLTRLPNLPESLVNLNCSNNNLTELPELPPKLEKLNCSGNNLAELPELPLGLVVLSCVRNQLTFLPTLPITLKYLTGHERFWNNLTELPPIDWALRYSTRPIMSKKDFYRVDNDAISAFTDYDTDFRIIYRIRAWQQENPPYVEPVFK